MKNKKLRTILAFIAIIAGFFMALLDTTIVNISLPKMAGYFNTNMQTISWVMNIYNIAFIVLMLAASRIADQFGRKRLFVIGLLAFTLTSCFIGFAPTFIWVIIFRLFQGISAAIIVPVTLPLILEIVSDKKIGMITGVWGAIGGLAAACGPALGGILTQFYSWRAVFFVNLPIGIIAIILTIVLLKESYDKTASKYIDFPGITVISIAVMTLTIGLFQAPKIGWNSPGVILLFISSFISFFLFGIIEMKSKDPMMPISLFKSLPFCASSITLIFATMGLMAGSFMIAFFLVKVMGLSQFDAGMTIIIMPISMMITSVIAGPLSQKIGSRILGVIGLILIGAAVFLFSKLGINFTHWDITWRLIILGTGIGMTIAPVMAGAIRLVPHEKVGIASGITNWARTFGMVLGIAILAASYGQNFNNEFLVTKELLIKEINASTIFSQDNRNSLLNKLATIQFSQSNMGLDINQFNAVIDQNKDKALATDNSLQDQKNELKSIFMDIHENLTSGIFISFEKTFNFFSFLFLLGIVIALFIEPIKTRGNQKIIIET